MTDESGHISWRNLVRERILEVAAALENEEMRPRNAAEELRRLARADVADLDADDIEVDFETGTGGGLAPLLAIGSSRPDRQEASSDPVEAALAEVLRLRDRNNGLRIVAETPGADDLAAYVRALDALRTALNAARASQEE